MRKPVSILFIAIIMPFLSGCDLLEELSEVEIPLTFDGDIAILKESAVSNPNDNITVESQIGFYSIAGDPEVKELLDEGAEITKVTIDRVIYSYKNFEGDEEAFLLDGQMIIREALTSTTEVYPFVDSGTRIADADFRNESFQLLGNFAPIESALVNPASGLGISYICVIDRNPVSFDIGVTVNLTVTVKADI
ncbi:hypothetical protein [Algoriphagus sediminis]|uniref:DUF4249 family protein n=1 Tax=Algoriphagus sediminis TaxID=3057113 RepID=A0ABT7YD67_9BACT|nr:hypothetical protein [Algoriphagus sediminis]MDN3204470.1 hypothetical protein [Algoriphagus sediminis]